MPPCRVFQLEKLQSENAQEWALREKLGTEKLGLERENKKLRGEVAHLEEELGRRSRQANVALDLDMKTMHEELGDKAKVEINFSVVRSELEQNFSTYLSSNLRTMTRFGCESLLSHLSLIDLTEIMNGFALFLIFVLKLFLFCYLNGFWLQKCNKALHFRSSLNCDTFIPS